MARTDFVKEIGTGLVFVGLVDKKQHLFRVENTGEGCVFSHTIVTDSWGIQTNREIAFK